MRGTPTKYFKSLNRHFHIFGVNRQLFYLFVGVCLPIAFSSRLMPVMDSVAIVVFLILYTIGVLITRVDDQILSIYRRHISYRKYYSTSTGIHARLSRLTLSVPFYQGKRGII